MIVLNKNKTNYAKIFIFLTAISLLQAMFFYKHGYFYIENMNSDPGGDLFLSIFASKELTPYLYQNFPYPPFCVLFYLLSFFDTKTKLIPIAYNDLPNVLKLYNESFAYKNINFVIEQIAILCLIYIIFNIFRKNKFYDGNYIINYILSIFILLNAGFLCAIARENSILISFLFLFIFVYWQKSDKLYQRIIANLFFALSFCFKPYTAIFGLLLLKKNNIKNITITILFTLLFFFVPFFFLKGGFTLNITLFIKQLTDFSKSVYGKIGIDELVFIFVKGMDKLFNIHVSFNLLSIIFKLFILTFTILALFITDKYWQKLLSITLLLLLIFSNFGYIISFMIIPFVYFLKEERECLY